MSVITSDIVQVQQYPLLTWKDSKAQNYVPMSEMHNTSVTTELAKTRKAGHDGVSTCETRLNICLPLMEIKITLDIGPMCRMDT